MKVKLEDVCDRGTSNLKQSEVVDQIGDYPIYGAAGYIGNVNFYHQDKPYVAVVKDGAGIGRTYFHQAKSSVIGTMQYLLPKDNVLPEYLYYVVSYMHLEKFFTGATIPHIYFKDYKEEQFNLDSLEKQAKIVEILERCEGIITSRKLEIKKLDQLIKARFVEMFGNAGLYITSYNSTYSELGLRQSKLWKKGTLCITIAANIAKTSILEFDACFPDSIVGFIANEKTNNILFTTGFLFFNRYLNLRHRSLLRRILT